MSRRVATNDQVLSPPKVVLRNIGDVVGQSCGIRPPLRHPCSVGGPIRLRHVVPPPRFASLPPPPPPPPTPPPVGLRPTGSGKTLAFLIPMVLHAHGPGPPQGTHNDWCSELVMWPPALPHTGNPEVPYRRFRNHIIRGETHWIRPRGIYSNRGRLSCIPAPLSRPLPGPGRVLAQSCTPSRNPIALVLSPTRELATQTDGVRRGHGGGSGKEPRRKTWRSAPESGICGISDSLT